MTAMPPAARPILAEGRPAEGQHAHAGGVDAACAIGLVSDIASLRSFLLGRLWTVGSAGAVAAAAVCSRASTTRSNQSLFRSVEAELDARIASPAARAASRNQGGEALRHAAAHLRSPIIDDLARCSTSSGHRPHHPTVVGAVAATTGATPTDAAVSAAYASVATAAVTAQTILRLDPAEVEKLGRGMAPEIARLADEAARAATGTFAQIPCFVAPIIDFLEEQAAI